MDTQITQPFAGAKFSDPTRTATGEARAQVRLERLSTLWFNTGTLCNIACVNCYIESSPRNDRLAYLSLADVTGFLDEIADQDLGTETIGLTGGEPFMNPEIMAILELCLARGFKVLVLTNAMKPMAHKQAGLAALAASYPQRLTLRVSVDHYTQAGHEAVRGAGTWAPMCAGLTWLAAQPVHLHVAARLPANEDEACLRAGFQRWFDDLGLPLDAHDPVAMMAFPEMDNNADVPEITTACWDILGVAPSAQMCASSRMVVKAKGAAAAHVVACTLLPYEPGFNLGASLATARRTVALNHRHCAKFCVLGGAACSA